jgi:hypothetical protein
MTILLPLLWVEESENPPFPILLRGIQLNLVQGYSGSTVKMVFSCKTFTFYEATLVALPNAWRRSVRVLS